MLNTLSIEFKTPLNNNVLSVKSLKGREALSELFHFDLIFATQKPISPNELIGKAVTIILSCSSDGFITEKRYINGMVIELKTIRPQENEPYVTFYKTKVVPQLALLRYRKNCRIFQRKTIKQILEKILKENKIDHYQIQLMTEHNSKLEVKDEYYVQYRESDFNFISRLLQHQGIFYFFKHENDKHTVVITDDKTSYSNDQAIKAVLAVREQEGIRHWEQRYQFFSGKWTYNEYDSLNPEKILLASSNSQSAIADNSHYDVYDYPGQYQDTSRGSQLSEVRMQYEENNYNTFIGSSTYFNMALSRKILLSDPGFPQEERNKEYIITEIEHEVQSQLSASNKVSFLNYNNHFTCIPAKNTFRPTLTIQPPSPGVQLATVIGAEGKEIETDPQGRVQVQFTWYRKDNNDDKDDQHSCWIRAIQHWDGLLRIGTPVLVDFIDADINKPIILGPVYNGKMMPLNDLSNTGNQTQSVLKRRYINKSKEDKYNEIRLEDKLDNQWLAINATGACVTNVGLDLAKQKNSTQAVKAGDYVLNVSKNLIQNVNEGSFIFEVKGEEKKCTIKLTGNANMTISIPDGNVQLNVKTINIQASDALSLNAKSIDIKADSSLTLSGSSINIKANTDLTLKGGVIKEN